LGVRVVDADEGLAIPRVDEALLDGEGAYRRGAVAAVARVVDVGLAHLHLREGVVHLGARMGGGTDDARLGEGRDAAAEAVELTAVRIRAAEGGEEDVVALGARAGQVALVEDETAARAAAHVDGAYACLGHVIRPLILPFLALPSP